jgi:hypothetical protein
VTWRSLEWGTGKTLGGLAEDGRGNALRVFRYFAAPKTQHGPTVLFQEARAVGICGTIKMLAAIQFHRQPCLAARDINDERADDGLTREARMMMA